MVTMAFKFIDEFLLLSDAVNVEMKMTHMTSLNTISALPVLFFSQIESIDRGWIPVSMFYLISLFLIWTHGPVVGNLRHHDIEIISL